MGVALVPAAEAAKRPGSVKFKADIAQNGEGANEQKQNRKIRKARRKANFAHRRIANLKEFAFGLASNNRAQQGEIDSLEAIVAEIVAGVPRIVNGLTALESGLRAIQAALEGPIAEAFSDIEDGFEEVEDALEDPTTGLVGLNLARPQFGVFLPAGTFQGGTGPVNGADPPHGPDGNAANGTGIGAPSLYVVDFNNDVSSRVYSVNVFPGSAAGATPTGAAVNCALAASTCNAVSAGTGNTSHVLVKIGTGAQAVDGTSFGGFSVTALSG